MYTTHTLVRHSHARVCTTLFPCSERMEGRDVSRGSSAPTGPFLTNTSGVGTLTRGGTLSRGGTLTRNKPGSNIQSGYETMDTLKRSRGLASDAGTLPRGHKPVSTFEPDYDAVEDDDAIRKVDLGAPQDTRGYGNPSYDDEDDFDY